jgi:hypothetical protein
MKGKKNEKFKGAPHKNAQSQIVGFITWYRHSIQCKKNQIFSIKKI